MTVEELKVEADKLGFRLARKPEPLPKRLPCICGSKRIVNWYSTGSNRGHFYACEKCGLEAPIGKNKREQILNWNETVMKAMEEKNV